jgi:hypothetical protein
LVVKSIGSSKDNQKDETRNKAAQQVIPRWFHEASKRRGDEFENVERQTYNVSSELCDSPNIGGPKVRFQAFNGTRPGYAMGLDPFPMSRQIGVCSNDDFLRAVCGTSCPRDFRLELIKRGKHNLLAL